MKENLIFKAVVGSQSYGTAIPTSDIDHKGVYIQSHDDLLTFKYKEQIDVSKDQTYYEVRRFLQLLQSANPTVLELLYSPEDCIIEKKPVFDLIVQNRDKFLTQKCRHSFGGYAIAQIKKAKGLDKKMNWENSKVERKSILDFCYVIVPNGTTPLKDWLYYQRGLEATKQENYGVSKVPNARDLYFIYFKDKPELKYHGICNLEETSNDLRLSSIPIGECLKHHTMSYNKDGYIEHCKDYLSYQTWLKNRNTQRYVDVNEHGQKIDGKNLLHCRRLLDMAMEIATQGTINVRRPNADYLLRIRRGEVPLQEIIDKAQEDINGLDALFANSGLPKRDVDLKFINDLLLQIRHF